MLSLQNKEEKIQMSKIVFIGYIYSDQLLDSIQKWRSRISPAAFTFQKAFLKGLEQNGYEYQIVSIPLVESFPRIPKLFFHTCHFRWNSKDNNRMVGMINLPIIRLFSWERRLAHVLGELTKDNSEEITIIVYGVTSYTLRAIRTIRNRVKHIHLIAPDLPEYMSGNNNSFYRFAKTIDRRRIDKFLPMVDSFSILTKYMKEKLLVGNRKWILLEGIYENTISDVIEKEKGCCFLYSGTLNARYGIMDLVDAFSLIEGDEYQLWICGYGDSLEHIVKTSKADRRIKYLGIKTPEEVRILQRKATILVNPRHSSEEYTKYSFPSKTMEYLASGTPTLMCKLPGIPEEYYEHLIFFEDESVEGYRNKMVELSRMPKEFLRDKGLAASSFINDMKNSRVQARKVLNLIGL